MDHPDEFRDKNRAAVDSPNVSQPQTSEAALGQRAAFIETSFFETRCGKGEFLFPAPKNRRRVHAKIQSHVHQRTAAREGREGLDF